ncbi:MAG: RNB domain-containing ribonuclease [Anaerolineales bacterium]|nr:RNB domain-containing ribonuclease [Anaerolineales bacterium]
MNKNYQHHRKILQKIAHNAMVERGLLPNFSGAAMAEASRAQALTMQKGAPDGAAHAIRDLRSLLWSSIDNEDSRDLDQLTVADAMPAGKVKILVAIADVDSSVKNGSAIDGHARHNTTSVYTVAEIFPMLPEKLSTDVTSLNLNQDRIAIVVEMVIGTDGALEDSKIYKAWVLNHANLAYNSVAAWLNKKGDIPEEIAAVQGLAENLQMQDQAAQRMKKLRHLHGALSLETIEAKPVFDGDQIRALEIGEKNRAKEIIEDFMIAANGVTARYLSASGFPSIRRVVRTPTRWERIVEIAGEHKFRLPAHPDSKALEEFLIQEKVVDPLRFPDLSLTVIKLMGAGEYIAELPQDDAPGHFGLAVKDYAHSTAPNRRYPDLLTQRLLKSALGGKLAPYSKAELDVLAAYCTKAENAANKVERQVEKSAAALLLESRIGEHFDAIVTGASKKGTWVRLLSVPVEGKLVQGFEGLDVGERIRVQLVSVSVQKGFIDFKNVNRKSH